MENETQITLRDAIEQSVEKIETAKEPVEVKAEPIIDDAGRVRNPDGKFAPKEPKEPEVKQEPVLATVGTETVQALKPNRPSSWKKDYWGDFDKISAENPKLAEYLVQREKEFASGVSTYKAEAIAAKELTDAIGQFMPDLQKHNINPSQWIQNLGNAHRTLAMGTPEQKLQMFQKLASDYGVQINAGQMQHNPWADKLTQMEQKIHTFETERQRREDEAMASEIKKFETDTKQYPHFAHVREAMAGLLQSGAAPDLQSAYKMAVRNDDSLFESEVTTRLQAEQDRQKAAVEAAKSKVVSTKSATPKGPAATNGAQDRRALIAARVEAVAAGRI